MSDEKSAAFSRRAFAKGAAMSLAAGLTAPVLGASGATSASTVAAAVADVFQPLRARAITIGVLIFERMDQIDFTGPFAVLSRIPDSTLRVVTLDGRPVRDHKGLVLTPDMALADAPAFDVLHVPGGPGQEALMDNEPVLSLIKRQMDAQRVVFSVCTGALLVERLES